MCGFPYIFFPPAGFEGSVLELDVVAEEAFT